METLTELRPYDETVEPVDHYIQHVHFEDVERLYPKYRKELPAMEEVLSRIELVY